jgi:phage terminase large subunit-like protein
MSARQLGLTARQRLAMGWGLWRQTARAKQLAPAGDWRIWLILAGRMFGKTRTGAEQCVKWAIETPGVRIALVAATFDDGRDVMVEGDSGIINVLHRYGYREGKNTAPGVYTWNRSLGQLILPNGSRMDLYSGQKPRQLRGPQHHYAWCDELPHWQYPRATWKQVRYGLRLPHPVDKSLPFRTRTIVTTTPLPIPLLRELISRKDTVVTRGSSYENEANVDPETLAELRADYEGTAEGQQELHGDLLDDVAGALFTRKLIDAMRVEVPVPELERLVVTVDPAVEDDPDIHDATGYAVGGVGYPTWPGAMHADKYHLFLLHASQDWLEPTEAMKRAALLWDGFDADRVTIEANNGGKYLPAVLHAVDEATVGESIPHKIVKAPAGQDKKARARQLVALAEQGRVHIVGDACRPFEDEATTWTDAKGQPSPNVLDAVVWLALDMLPPQLRKGKPPREAVLHG